MNGGGTVRDIALSGELAPELLGGVRVTLYGDRRAVVEHHRGLLAYDEAVVELAGKPHVRILGAELSISAMDRETVIVSGRIRAVEYA